MTAKQINCPIEQEAKNHNNVAIYLSNQEITYPQLNHHINVVMDMLKSKLNGEKIICFALSNKYLQLLLSWALLRLNKTIFPLNHNLPMENLKNIITKHNITTFITDKNINSYIPIQSPSELEMLNSPLKNHQLNTVEAATIIHTSGSTGNPKGVVHAINHHIISATASSKLIPLENNDCWGWNLPLHHVSGLSILFRVFFAAASLYIPEKNEMLHTNKKITHISVVPTQLQDILTQPKSSPNATHHLKAILVGGDYCPKEILSKAINNNLPIYNTYGMSELASQIATQKCNTSNIIYSGELLPHVSAKLIDNELCIKSDSLCLGYLENRNLNKNITQNQWFHTKDIAEIHNNHIKIIGRKDRMFISGGENIYPEQIEQAILETSLVKYVSVKPADHPKYGKRPIAYIIPTHTEENINKLITKSLLKKIPKFMIPDEFNIIEKSSF